MSDVEGSGSGSGSDGGHATEPVGSHSQRRPPQTKSPARISPRAAAFGVLLFGTIAGIVVSTSSLWTGEGPVRAPRENLVFSSVVGPATPVASARPTPTVRREVARRSRRPVTSPSLTRSSSASRTISGSVSVSPTLSRTQTPSVPPLPPGHSRVPAWGTAAAHWRAVSDRAARRDLNAYAETTFADPAAAEAAWLAPTRALPRRFVTMLPPEAQSAPDELASFEDALRGGGGGGGAVSGVAAASLPLPPQPPTALAGLSDAVGAAVSATLSSPPFSYRPALPFTGSVWVALQPTLRGGGMPALRTLVSGLAAAGLRAEFVSLDEGVLEGDGEEPGQQKQAAAAGVARSWQAVVQEGLVAAGDVLVVAAASLAHGGSRPAPLPMPPGLHTVAVLLGGDGGTGAGDADAGSLASRLHPDMGAVATTWGLASAAQVLDGVPCVPPPCPCPRGSSPLACAGAGGAPPHPAPRTARLRGRRLPPLVLQRVVGPRRAGTGPWSGIGETAFLCTLLLWPPAAAASAAAALPRVGGDSPRAAPLPQAPCAPCRRRCSRCAPAPPRACG